MGMEFHNSKTETIGFVLLSRAECCAELLPSQNDEAGVGRMEREEKRLTCTASMTVTR